MKTSKIFWMFLLAGGLCACYEDKGNYDYITLNEITFKLPSGGGNAFLGEPYTLFPQLEFSDLEDTTSFEFWWEYTGTASEGGDAHVICEGRELRFVPNEVASMNIRLCAKELKTGIIMCSNDFRLECKSPYAKGWMVLSEESGKSILSIIRPSWEGEVRVYVPYLNIYAANNPDKPLGDNPFAIRQVMNFESSLVLILQKSGCVYLDGSGNFGQELALEREFVDGVPANFAPKDFFYSTGLDVILDESGKVYSRNYMKQGEYEPFFTKEFVNFPMEYQGEELKIEEIIPTMPSQTGFFGLYDKEKKRILWVNCYSARGEIFQAKMPEGDEFIDLNDFNSYALRFAGSWGAGSKFVTLFEQNNSFVIQQCKVAESGEVSELNKEAFSGGDRVTEDTKFFLLSTRPYLFLGDKNKVCWYDLDSGVTHEFYVFAEGEEVVGMATNPQESELGVALKSGLLVTLDIRNEMLYQNRKIDEVPIPGQIVALDYKYPSWMEYSFKSPD